MLNYLLVKVFKKESMPEEVKTFFEESYENKLFNFSAFYVNSVKGKTKDLYKGKKIICKWTWDDEEEKDDPITFIIERGDNVLFDWLIDNGLNIRDDDYVLIEH